jgi:ubiquinone/menaquinone biosynthesis C-methylase UbiE
MYDLIAKLLGADGARQTLFDLAPLRPGNRALDIGCGTGTFAVSLKQRFPDVEVVGLDPDPKALARASRKAEVASVPVRFDRGFADALESRNREKTLREVRRVLKPGGMFCLLDFETTSSGHGFLNLFHSGERLRDNTESRILTMMGEAGLTECRKIAIRPVLFGLGHAGYYQGFSPR